VPPRTGATLIDHRELKERPTPQEHNQKTQREYSKQKIPTEARAAGAKKPIRCAGKKTTYFRKESRSITNRYLTSLFSIRS
jgi:hypothetical protein